MFFVQRPRCIFINISKIQHIMTYDTLHFVLLSILVTNKPFIKLVINLGTLSSLNSRKCHLLKVAINNGLISLNSYENFYNCLFFMETYEELNAY